MAKQYEIFRHHLGATQKMIGPLSKQEAKETIEDYKASNTNGSSFSIKAIRK